MTNLVRIVYASTTTNPIAPEDAGIQKDIGRILLQSRENNRKQQIGGVLYFSNNYFFQCLEGESAAVNELYNKISQDPRHTDVRFLSVKPIQTRQFADWSMKYVALEDNVTKLLSDNGFSAFEPYKFDDEMVDKMLALFVSEDDPSLKETPSESDDAKKKSGWLSRFFKRRA